MSPKSPESTRRLKPANAVDRKGAVGGRERHGHERVGEHEPAVGLLGGGHRVAQAGRAARPSNRSRGRPPHVRARAGTTPGRASPCTWASGRSANRASRSFFICSTCRSSERSGQDADGDVDARVVLFDLDPGEVGALAQLVLAAELGRGRRAPRSWSARGRPRARSARRGSGRPRWAPARRGPARRRPNARPGERVHGDVAGLPTTTRRAGRERAR